MGHADSREKPPGKECDIVLRQYDTWCVIPVYNNSGTVMNVVSRVKEFGIGVLVVDDGSTDADLSVLFSSRPDITVIRHSKNRGKGAALVTAIEFLRKKNAVHMITMDADGQHNPDDLPAFMDAVVKDPLAVWVGARDFKNRAVPGSSRFGRRFSNMWFKIETGQDCLDTQSGFRAYPVSYISSLKLAGRHYDFEMEILVKAAWAGLKIKNLDISVHYPVPEERISHFKPFRDNFRISLMHTKLVGRRLLPLPHKRLVKEERNYKLELLRRPGAFFKMLLKENASPWGLAVSAAVGTILAVLPIIGLHTLAILYVSARLHLNKIMALSIQVLYSPPFVPFVCIEVGHYIRKGSFLTDFSLSSVPGNLYGFFADWLVGSLVMAPFYAVVAFFAVYYTATGIQNRMNFTRENRGNAETAG
ncbi:MAG: DUF2062 domain-containing protein [Thermodesulfobacteriota bacterium]